VRGAAAIDPAAGTIHTANGDNTVSIIPAIHKPTTNRLPRQAGNWHDPGNVPECAFQGRRLPV